MGKKKASKTPGPLSYDIPSQFKKYNKKYLKEKKVKGQRIL